MTARRYLSIDLAYREGEFFWIIVFPDSKFTVCSGDGSAIAEAHSAGYHRANPARAFLFQISFPVRGSAPT